MIAQDNERRYVIKIEKIILIFSEEKMNPSINKIKDNSNIISKFGKIGIVANQTW